MVDQTPTNKGESQEQPQNTSVIEVDDSMPAIDSVTMEGSGGFRGSPETVEATISYTTDTNGIVDLESTIHLTIDDQNVAHIEDISGDGTMAERFIPIMFVKQELSQHHPAIEGVAGVPSFGIVNNQLYENQPQFNANQQLNSQSASNELLNGDGKSPSSTTGSAKNGQQAQEANTSQNNQQHPSQSKVESEPREQEGESENATQDESKERSEADETDEEFGIDGEQLVFEDGEWKVDPDASNRDEMITTIKNDQRGVSMSIWDLREDDSAPDSNYGIVYYEGGDNTDVGVETKEELKEQVEQWKAEPPQVS